MQPAQVLSNFFETTSAHGFSRVYNSQGIRRSVWIVLIIAAFSGVTYHFTSLYLVYASHNKLINSQSRANDFVFPDVTFCPTYFFSRAKLNGFHNESDSWGPYNLLKFWEAARKVNATTIDLQELAFRSLRSIAYDFDIFKNTQDHIVSCLYQNDDCSFRNFTIYRHPTKLLCFTFTPGNRTLSVPGPSGSLKLILNLAGSSRIFSDDYMNAGVGYQISIHEQNTRPSFFRDYIIAQTASHLQVGIEMERGVLVNYPPGSCEEAPKPVELIVDFSRRHFEKATFHYMEDDCLVLYKQEMVKRTCGCQNDNWILNGSGVKHHNEFVLCHRIDSEPLLDLSEEDMFRYVSGNASEVLRQAGCFRQVSHRIINNPLSDIKTCYRPCSSVNYKTNSFAVKWPVLINETERVLVEKLEEVRQLARNLSLPIDPVIENYTQGAWWREELMHEFPFVSINIYAKSLSVTENRETLAMSFVEFIAGVGGILGLWIGFSVITLCEVGYFLVSFLHSIWHCNGRHSHGHKDIEDEAIDMDDSEKHTAPTDGACHVAANNKEIE